MIYELSSLAKICEDISYSVAVNHSALSASHRLVSPSVTLPTSYLTLIRASMFLSFSTLSYLYFGEVQPSPSYLIRSHQASCSIYQTAPPRYPCQSNSHLRAQLSRFRSLQNAGRKESVIRSKTIRSGYMQISRRQIVCAMP